MCNAFKLFIHVCIHTMVYVWGSLLFKFFLFKNVSEHAFYIDIYIYIIQRVICFVPTSSLETGNEIYILGHQTTAYSLQIVSNKDIQDTGQWAHFLYLVNALSLTQPKNKPQTFPSKFFLQLPTCFVGIR